MAKNLLLFALSVVSADFVKITDAACGVSDNWVGNLPGYTVLNPGDVPPCSYAGTLASSSDGSH